MVLDMHRGDFHRAEGQYNLLFAILFGCHFKENKIISRSKAKLSDFPYMSNYLPKWDITLLLNL